MRSRAARLRFPRSSPRVVLVERRRRFYPAVAESAEAVSTGAVARGSAEWRAASNGK
ncbi:hypothetical protein AKJ09_05590 [Labilithrix luteola]|uniref:Uncharacterized protein n=1 Tax=Labilithrix luteola TaxID=1391654 RepID=A0A0K1PZW7_9BACT|nr:hypothetical protein AKJ09_05590 [Labilithrix luteola]